MTATSSTLVRVGGQRLVDAFEACTLEAGAFGHAEHVEVAWHYLRAHPADRAFALFAVGLQRLAAHFGVPDKYDESITRAFMELIDGRMRLARDNAPEGGPEGERDDATSQQDWERFSAENADLLRWPNDLVKPARNSL